MSGEEKRAALGSVIGAAQIEDFDVVSHRLVHPFQIFHADIGLLVVHFVDVIAADGMGNVPFLGVTDALRLLHPGRGDGGHVAPWRFPAWRE